MSNSSNILTGLGMATIAILIAWLVIENDRKSKIIKKLEIDRLKLIKDSLNHNKAISYEIKGQLLELLDQYKDINPSIAKELATALSIVNAGEDEKGIGCMSIIIENLLKIKYKSSSKFIDWLKNTKKRELVKAVQADYIEFAKVDKLIEKEEYDFACAVKNIRNSAFHEMGKEIAWNYSKAGLLIGIGLILKIGSDLQNIGLIR